MMRRTKMAVLGMMMVLSVTACAGKAELKNIDMESTAQGTTAEKKTKETVKAEDGENVENMVGIPNPYTDHDSLKEAEEEAGFKIQIPDEIRGAKAAAFWNLRTEMLEVIYYEGYSTGQVAKLLGRKESSVRSDLKRGRERLKMILKEAYDFE